MEVAEMELREEKVMGKKSGGDGKGEESMPPLLSLSKGKTQLKSLQTKDSVKKDRGVPCLYHQTHSLCKVFNYCADIHEEVMAYPCTH